MPSIWHDPPFGNRNSATSSSTNQNNHPQVISHHPKTAPTVRKIYNNPMLENNSDQSDYGELRAIVQRIERNHNESKSVSPTKYPAKKMVFDYVPASVMMKK